MKIKVTLISVLFTLYTLVCFTPSYFSNSLTNLLSNGFVILAIGLLFIKRYKPSKFMLLTVIYFVFLITMSFVNGSKQADYHLVLSNLKNVLFWAVTEWSVKNDTKRAINTLFYVLLIFVLLDFMSILVFPDGLYYSSIVWSDWNEGKMPLWVLGNKNNRICWYMLLLMLGCWKRLNDGKKSFNLILVMLMIMSLVAMILVDSATSTVVIIIMCIGVWLSVLKEKGHKLDLNLNIIYPVYLIVLLAVLFSSMSFLQNFLENILGRDTTFTNRTTIWMRVILLILQKPLFGFGIIPTAESADILGSAAFTSAHNQVLQTLWEGGICGLVLLILIFLRITRHANRYADSNLKMLLFFFISALLVEFLFETSLTSDSAWVFMLLCYQIINTHGVLQSVQF